MFYENIAYLRACIWYIVQEKPFLIFDHIHPGECLVCTDNKCTCTKTEAGVHYKLRPFEDFFIASPISSIFSTSVISNKTCTYIFL